jgi:NAD+ kinase
MVKRKEEIDNATMVLAQELSVITRFTEQQIIRLHKDFVSRAGSKGFLTEQDFALTLQSVGMMDAEIRGKYLDTFDRSGSRIITFEDYVMGLSQILRAVKDDAAYGPMIMTRSEPKLVWLKEEGPRKVLVVKKEGVESVSAATRKICHFLRGRGLQVLIEPQVAREWNDFEACDPTQPIKDVDVMICVGGDGTMLHVANLIQDDQKIPPVMAFGMGALGFLTPFDVANHEADIDRMLHASPQNPMYCTLRGRLKCEVFVDSVKKYTYRPLNECLLDRGASPALSKLALFIDGNLVTIVQADGLIIATPSGSTAYNTAAGGPMVVPSVHCTLITPIAPHSLSFRPIVVPDTSVIEVRVPDSARAGARVSFDGRSTVQLARGSAVRVEKATYPFPFVTMERGDIDWYNGIKKKLSWNVPTHIWEDR